MSPKQILRRAAHKSFLRDHRCSAAEIRPLTLNLIASAWLRLLSRPIGACSFPPGLPRCEVDKIFEELDYQQTSLGELSLRRKRVATLGGLEVYEVKLNEGFLMSSMFHAVEDALADLGLAELAPGDWDVVVGGLGLGYTALAALAHPTVRSLLVVDLLEAVIGWHRNGIVPLGPKLTADPRCRFLHGDFFALAMSAGGFESGRRYHAVLLDIDHSPGDLLHERHGAFYSVAGLQAMAAHLHPGGVFAMWSEAPPDAEFLQLLHEVFAFARAEVVAFPNPILGCDSESTVYVARASV